MCKHKDLSPLSLSLLPFSSAPPVISLFDPVQESSDWLLFGVIELL